VTAKRISIIGPTALAFCAVALGSSAAPGSSPAVNSTGQPASSAASRKAPALQIAAGDLLEVIVFDTPELSARLRVDSKGEVTLPLGEVVHVAGETAEQAGALIETRLRERDVLKQPHVTVFIAEYATQGVSVLGEVRIPGVYPALGTHGMLDFISLAGGVTSAAGKSVSITHKSDPAHPVIVLLDNAPDMPARANVEILPGDTILVSRSGIVYLVGDLARPGGFLIENNDRLTVLQAIALAQGANRTAKLSNARLIRKTPEGRKETMLDLKKILQGKSPDIPLEDNDILFVPSSEAKNMAYRSVEATIGLATGAIIYGTVVR